MNARLLKASVSGQKADELITEGQVGEGTKEYRLRHRQPEITGNWRGMNMKNITDEQEETLVTWFERWWSMLPKGVGAKVDKGKGRTAWLKAFKILPVGESGWEELRDVIVAGSAAQEEYRRRIFKQYPDEQTRKKAGVFIRSRCHPATWLNGERWNDEIPEIKSSFEVYKTEKGVCSECPKERAVLVDGVGYCAWCWGKKFAPNALDRLRDKARELGLARREGETAEDVAVRAREVLKSKSSVIAGYF